MAKQTYERKVLKGFTDKETKKVYPKGAVYQSDNQERINELVKKKFQQGIVNNVTYLDALTDKFNARSQLQTALNEVEYQKAVLLYEMGKEIKGAIQ